MDIELVATENASEPTGSGRFSWLRFCLWLPACLIVGLTLARAAVIGQSYFAPLVIFPLLVGVGVGAMIFGLMRVGQVGNRPTIVLGTLLAVAAAIGGQHFFSYQAACEHIRRESQMVRSARLAFPDDVRGKIPGPPDPPAGLGEFLSQQAARGRPLLDTYVARGWMAWMSWAMDGLLTLGASLAMVLPAMRQPFCNRCRSWYRVIRSGRVARPVARRLAETAGIAVVDDSAAARCRLLSCIGGCGPTGFELGWDRSPDRTSAIRVWLDTQRRNRITHILDEAAQEECGE